jgi:AraC-like DNA-binding protein
MRDHYASPITNQQLAGVAHMSVRAFERKFLRSFHLSPQKYLRKLRVRIASHALAYTSQSLAEVAMRCGFADQSHFAKEFRRQFGRTPRDYRAHYGAHTAAAVPSINSAVRALEPEADGNDIGDAVRRRRSDAQAPPVERCPAIRAGKLIPQLVAK